MLLRDRFVVTLGNTAAGYTEAYSEHRPRDVANRPRSVPFPGVTVVIGVDGSGRTHRLRQLAAASTAPVTWFDGTAIPGDHLVIVDDAHRLGADSLRALTIAARAGV